MLIEMGRRIGPVIWPYLREMFRKPPEVSDEEYETPETVMKEYNHPLVLSFVILICIFVIGYKGYLLLSEKRSIRELENDVQKVRVKNTQLQTDNVELIATLKERREAMTKLRLDGEDMQSEIRNLQRSEKELVTQNTRLREELQKYLPSSPKVIAKPVKTNVTPAKPSKYLKRLQQLREEDEQEGNQR